MSQRDDIAEFLIIGSKLRDQNGQWSLRDWERNTILSSYRNKDQQEFLPFNHVNDDVKYSKVEVAPSAAFLLYSQILIGN